MPLGEGLPRERIARDRWRLGAEGSHTASGGSGGRVDVVAVDGDRDAAMSLPDVSLVLVEPLVVAPLPAGHVGVACGLPAVPVGHPKLIRLDVTGTERRHEVCDPRALVAVDPRLVTGGVQLPCPGAQEGQD